jgi:tetratricopeptide (TPR) repeat protein
MAAMSWGPEPARGISFVPPGDREKEKGNALFKEGNFEAALASYRRGLDAVRTDLTAHGIAARFALHLNCAAALLKLERPHDAITACTDAMAVDGRSMKAMLRRAKAYLGVSMPHSLVASAYVVHGI